MKRLDSNQNILASKDVKRISRRYNKMAKTVAAFDYLRFQTRVQPIETANESLQVIRKAKMLDRAGSDFHRVHEP